MKINTLILSLSCILLAGAVTGRAETTSKTASAATAPQAATKQTQELLRAFYVEYCTLIAQSGDSHAAEQRLLDTHLTRQLLQKTEGIDYMPLIRAQDFNAKALPTISVTHVDGQWYAAAYLDTYNHRCVVVPVKAVVEQGVLRITDITLP